MLHRKDLQIIYHHINPKSKVLDLGCGEGLLLKELIEKKNVNGLGIEISLKRIKKCMEKGISVIQEDLNEGLCDFNKNSFDFVILSQTLEEISKPVWLIKEMLRVGEVCIISFENLAYWRKRLTFLITGTFNNDTNIENLKYSQKKQQLLTVKRFLQFCSSNSFRICKRKFIPNGDFKITNLFPNFFSRTAIFFLKEGDDKS